MGSEGSQDNGQQSGQDQNDQQNDQQGQQNGGADSGGQSGSGGSEGGKGEESSKDQGGTVTRAEFDSLMARMQAADRRANEAETKVRAHEDKDKTELEKATRDRDEAVTERDTLRERLTSQSMQIAFRDIDAYAWHNPARAFSLLDLSGVKVGEDGTVTGMDKAVDALAKSDAYLIKPKGDDEGEDSEDDDKGGASGAGVGSGSKGKGGMSRADLEKKYPALRK